MNISKSYNHKILNDNRQIVDFNSFDPNFIYDIYDNLHNHQIFFIDKITNYNVQIFNRDTVHTKQLLYRKIHINKFKSEYEFAIFHDEINNTVNKCSHLLSEYYPNDWQDCLIYYDLKFVSYLFIQFMENECDKLMKISNDKHNINIMYSSKITNDAKISSIVYHILNIVEWMTNKYRPDHKLTLNIMLSPIKKTYYNTYDENFYNFYDWACWTKLISDDSIKPININSGVSLNYDGNHIILFREDEIYKVLIHELIHNIGIDMNEHVCNNLCEKTINQNVNFNVGNSQSYPIIYNEAYVEYHAILLWNYYLVCYFCNDISNRQFNEKKKLLYLHMITQEIINSAIQCKKLFDYYKITSFDIFKNENNIIQYTNAFSYIFIKYLLLINNYRIHTNPDNYIKNAFLYNTSLQKWIMNMENYNYLFDIITTKNSRLNLSLYNLNMYHFH